MKPNTLSAIALLMISTTALADTMTLKIPLKVVLMRDEAASVRVRCTVQANPYSSVVSQVNAIANGTAPTPITASSELYPLDPFGNLDKLVPIEVNLDAIRNLDKHFLQSGPSYSCYPEFLNDAGDPVLTYHTPQTDSQRSQLYDMEKSVFNVEAFNIVPDAPSRTETLFGGRSNTGDGKLKSPTQGLKLQR